MSPSATTTVHVETVAGGVTTPRGFRAAGVHAGIKAKGLDLALLVSDEAATAAAVFTTNRAQAAPVLVSRQHLERTGGRVRAIVVNSGCANACTGDEGLAVARDASRARIDTPGVEVHQTSGTTGLRPAHQRCGRTARLRPRRAGDGNGSRADKSSSRS